LTNLLLLEQPLKIVLLLVIVQHLLRILQLLQWTAAADWEETALVKNWCFLQNRLQRQLLPPARDKAHETREQTKEMHLTERRAENRLKRLA
jgi:hypothetical protein